MSAEQGSNRNKVKKLCIYALLVAACMVAGYVESFIPTNMLVPGCKIGLSNAVALILVAKGDIKGAFSVNITRILLFALIFGNLFSLLFSLSGGIVSLAVTSLLSKIKKVSLIGISIAGAVTHNIAQLIVSLFVTGYATLFYAPLLIVAGILSGLLIGLLCSIIFKKLKTNGSF